MFGLKIFVRIQTCAPAQLLPSCWMLLFHASDCIATQWYHQTWGGIQQECSTHSWSWAFRPNWTTNQSLNVFGILDIQPFLYASQILEEGIEFLKKGESSMSSTFSLEKSNPSIGGLWTSFWFFCIPPLIPRFEGFNLRIDLDIKYY